MLYQLSYTRVAAILAGLAGREIKGLADAAGEASTANGFSIRALSLKAAPSSPSSKAARRSASD